MTWIISGFSVVYCFIFHMLRELGSVIQSSDFWILSELLERMMVKKSIEG